jgi:hypothetical protein
LTGNFGTCKTGDNDNEFVQRMDPRPTIGAMEPSATRTLSLSEQGVYERNRFEAPVIWFVAPVSIIQGFDLVVVLA